MLSDGTERNPERTRRGPGHQQAAPEILHTQGQAPGAPRAPPQKPRETSAGPRPRPTGPGLLVTGGSGSQKPVQPLPGRPHAQGSPEVTYSSRGSQLLAALARGIQTDVFTLTSLLTGVFALGETGREESTGDGPSSRPQARRAACREPYQDAPFMGKRTVTVCTQVSLGNSAPGSENKTARPPLTCVTGDTHFLLDLLQRCQGPFNCPGEAHPSPLCHGGDSGVPSVVGGKNGGKEATTKMTQRAGVVPAACICSAPLPATPAPRSTAAPSTAQERGPRAQQGN